MSNNQTPLSITISQTIAVANPNDMQTAATALDTAVPIAIAAIIASPPTGLVPQTVGVTQPYTFFFDGTTYNAIAVITYNTLVVS